MQSVHLMPQTPLTIIRASAGAGKTYTLATRFVAHLLATVHNPNAHREMLGITFTNKATTEMKERILSFLYRLKEQVDSQLLADILVLGGPEGLIPEEVPIRATKALNLLTSDYSNFSILTIDSFFQRLLHTVAYELGVVLNSRVEISNDEAVDDAVDNFLKHPGEDKKVLDWLVGYIEQQMEESSQWMLRKDLGKFAKRNLLAERYQELDESSKKQLSSASDLKRYEHTLKEIAERANQRALDAEEACRHILELHSEKISSYNHYEGFLNKIQIYFSSAYSWEDKKTIKYSGIIDSISKKVEKPEGIFKKAYRGAEYDASLESVLLAIRKLQSELSAAFSDLITCKTILKSTRPLCLLLDLEQRLNVVLRTHNSMLLSRTKMLFSKLIGESDSPFVFERVGTRFSYIMIDEFQDTALTQWKNIKKLLLNSLAGGFSCVVVGDVKQSIYRWNDGDWRILHNMENEPDIKRLGQPETITLDNNFRTLANVVNFNNELFPLLAKQIDSDAKRTICQEIYSESTTQQIPRKGKGGYVRLCFSRKNGKVVNGETSLSLGSQILSLHARGLKWTDMAILVRNKSAIKNIKSHLQSFETKIPLVTSEMFEYSSSRLVLALVSALRWLYANRNYKQGSGRKMKETVAVAYLKELSRDYNAQPESENLPPHADGYLSEAEVLGQLYDERSKLLKLPLVECCHRIVELLNLDELIQEDNAFLLSFLDEVSNFVAREGSKLSSFLRYFDEVLAFKTIPPTQPDGIQILTIHKAKGLEFHTVFIPKVDWSLTASRHDSEDYLWMCPQEEPYNQLNLLPVNIPKDLKESVAFSEAYNKEMTERLVDNLNLVYVAFTRPRANLFIWAEDVEIGMSLATVVPSLSCLHEVCVEEDEEVLEEGRVRVFETGEIAIPATEKLNVVSDSPFEAQATEVNFRWENSDVIPHLHQSNVAKDFLDTTSKPLPKWRTLIDRGKLRHKIMEYIGCAKDLERAIATVYHQGLINEEERISLFEEFSKILQQPCATDWFDGSWIIFNETTFLNPQLKLTQNYRAYRPDRVMKRGDEVVVIDFKFSTDADNVKYKRQVRNYVDLLHKVGYVNVKGFLWYVDLEEVIPV